MQTSDGLRTYYGRVVSAIPELFNMAYAICGNYDLAEYALEYTLMEAWVGENHGGIGFRENLRNTLKRVAMEEALELRAETPEFTWNGLCGERESPFLAALAQESVETRRAVALRYGCELPAVRIAKLMDCSPGHVHELLDRFERRVRRRLSAGEKRRFDALASRSVRQAFSETSEDMPSLSAIYRSFIQEAAETQRPRHLAAKIVRRSVSILLAVLCALMFWFAAALVHPALETPAAMEQGSE